MKPAVSIQNLSKRYTLQKSASYVALRDVMNTSLANFFKAKSHSKDAFWALKDIDLQIGEGERIGIIGHNGAGKSTLLKILSRITPPSSGKVTMRGRVASLLEVGTGFHPELTGRENIYLNGSILGITKAEINKSLDEIIDFSGVEKFIDTPIKNYSSGMQLRLAFSVAAHLQAEILLIDEVLAVGDLEFQKKCVGKMEEVSSTNGRTILFVSHNLQQLSLLCNKGVILSRGSIKDQGPIIETIRTYVATYEQHTHTWRNLKPKKDCCITEIKIKDRKGQPITTPTKGPTCIEVSIYANATIKNSLIAVRFTNAENIPVYTTTIADDKMSFPVFESGIHTYEIVVPTELFIPGRYSIIVSWNVPNVTEIDAMKNELYVDIIDENYAGDILKDARLGILNKTIPWKKL